jgi:glycosyltransferase involved in cell wall biosynthesis
VVLSLNPGGTERLVVDLTSRLNADLPTMVCCLDAEGAWASELRSRRIEVVALGRGPGFRPRLGHAIAALAERHRATVIHAHHYSPFVYSCVARLWRPGLRVVFTEHGRLSDAPPSSKRRLANQVLARFPHKIFAVSEGLKAHMVGEGFSADAIDVLYNGIDVGPLPDAAARSRARERLGVGPDVLVIGTIARLDPVKDLETLIRAVAQVSEASNLGPGVRSPLLIIVGDGSERARLENVAAELRVTSCVRFLGHRDDARDYLAACDIYANSSITEGVSLTILEAMAAGVPVVATRVGGTPEVIDQTCGRLTPPRDPAAFASAVMELAADPALRLRLGQRGRQVVETRFTLDRMVRQYRCAYGIE